MGGAVFNLYATVTITNCTITNNTAKGGLGGSDGTTGGNGLGFGGGVAQLNGSNTIAFSTIVKNSADHGGAVFAVQDKGGIKPQQKGIGSYTIGSPGGTGFAGANVTLDLDNSILSGSLNSVTDLADLSIGSGSIDNGNTSNYVNNNLIQSYHLNGGITLNSTNILNTTPSLGSLQNNGGLTDTMTEQQGSKTIDKGNNSAKGGISETVDQRGVTRDTPPDIGAYEYSGTGDGDGGGSG